jgi:hypothetical protein
VSGDAMSVMAAVRMAVEDFEPSQAAVAAARRASLAVAAAPAGLTRMPVSA